VTVVDLSQLETLVAVAQEKGFSRAAERLHRTQSAVSQAVRRLEEEVGVLLFDRSSKGGTLTEAGTVLFGYAEQLLNVRREARAALQELENLQRGTVSIAVNEYTVMHLLPFIETCRARHPHLRVHVKRSFAREIPSEVLGREVEIGVITYRPSQPGLSVVQVASDELALLVAPRHPLSRRTEVSIRELGAESFLAHNQRSPYRDRVVRMFERHRTPLHVAIELPTLEAIKRLVERGLGVALIPRRAAEAELARGDVVALAVREMRFERPIHVIHRSGAQLSHAARAFVGCARETGGDAGKRGRAAPRPPGEANERGSSRG
jgi:DNA-binding transcriptional LysR family regulator